MRAPRLRPYRILWRALFVVALASACRGRAPAGPEAGAEDAAMKKLLDGYVIGFLKRNPVVSTYLGGAGLDPALSAAEGRLRDHSAAALAEEDRWLAETADALSAIDPARLSAAARIDREVSLAQIRFQLRLHGVRRHQERALDTYVDEPFRGVDWQLQGMTKTGEATYGTAAEWARVAERVAAIPAYLAVAEAQLAAGVAAKNTPDHRVLERHGLKGALATAEYFAEELPKLAEERVAAPDRAAVLARLAPACAEAARAYRGLRGFVAKTFYDDADAEPKRLKPEFSGDRYMMGEEEYNFALKNNLRLTADAAALYEASWPVVLETRAKIVALAREIGAARGLSLPGDDDGAVRAVLDNLEETEPAPRSDEEMIAWYSETAQRLVEYARSTGLFDVPGDYKLEVVPTPPPLQASLSGAAYYPAPPFKDSGVGRFYVSPTKGDPAALKENHRSALADLAAHEGFPGHDWHYKVITGYRGEISPVRWLTPGAVEDSSSMWEDSMAAEGWALYAEALLAEPAPGAPGGFYTPEERLFQLQGKLYRDLRVRVDIGIHTGRLSYDEAVELFSAVVGFEPGSCKDAAAAARPEKRASCASSERAIFRYSKWPTQAITYRLGRDQIVALREEASRRLGAGFSLKRFHLLFMKQGTIPPGYFGEELLRALAAGEGR